MDFSFLFDNSQKLFAIGYRAADGSLDSNCYDLLASEARLTSFIAIAKGDVPSAHWFRLGRALTPTGRGSALISWSGSMFEYLMPSLVMRSPADSLLSSTNEQVGIRQIEYGAERGVPWGISESAYNARDLDFTYQYSSFGVPGLGLKRGLSEDLVIAPYATALASMINQTAASGKFRPPGARGGPRRLRILRSAGLHQFAPAGGRNGCGDTRLHGPSPGNVARGFRQRGDEWRDAHAFPFRSDHSGHRTVAAGTHAARRAGGTPASRRSLGRGARPRIGGTRGAPVLTPNDPRRAPNFFRMAVMA